MKNNTPRLWSSRNLFGKFPRPGVLFSLALKLKCLSVLLLVIKTLTDVRVCSVHSTPMPPTGLASTSANLHSSRQFDYLERKWGRNNVMCVISMVPGERLHSYINQEVCSLYGGNFIPRWGYSILLSLSVRILALTTCWTFYWPITMCRVS